MTEYFWLLLVGIHLLVAVGLTFYGVHQVAMVVLSWRSWPRKQAEHQNEKKSNLDRADWPRVTVQLPLYNERFVAQRSIRSACALDYPRELLQIQVLDDSSDDTVGIVDEAVEEAKRSGHVVEIVRRSDRVGFKAGALAAAMPTVTGEFVAIFDADFVPAPDFLERMVVRHGAFADPKIGFLQGRWGHFNRDESLLTRAQGAMHDGHFLIEQVARSSTGLWFNFNGSGGVWRRACIEDAGGWQTDTLTEDLDLSYRAWSRGWRGAYTPWVVAPGELPVTLSAFRRQQFRWARGSIQTAKKLATTIAGAPDRQVRKLAALAHVSAYMLHPLMWGFMVTWPLVIFARDWSPGAELPKLILWVLSIFSPSCLAFLIGMGVALRRQDRSWRKIVPDVLMAALVGLSMVSSNTIAVCRGLFGRSTGVFERTPKSKVGERTVYRIGLDGRWWAELGLSLYLSGAVVYALNSPRWWWALPLAFYAVAAWLGVVLQFSKGKVESAHVDPEKVEAQAVA